MAEAARASAAGGDHDTARWRCHTRLEQFDAAGNLTAVDEVAGNLLMFGGASALWGRLTGDTSVAVFSAANARLGVGDGTAAEAATQNDLQGATKTRKGMDATYPQHNDGTVDGAQTVTFRSTFGPDDANHDWSEWGVFNDPATGRMLNRKVHDFGRKAQGTTWALTVTISLA
jgi:hypothetical protein